MGAIASQITSLTIVYSTVYSDADQRKHQRSASLAFVRGIHRGPVNSPHKWPVMRKMFPFDDVIMTDPEPRACDKPGYFQITYKIGGRVCICVVLVPSLTDWGRDKMVAIFQTTFSNASYWMKLYKFRLRFHWSLFPRVQLTIFQHWFR